MVNNNHANNTSMLSNGSKTMTLKPSTMKNSNISTKPVSIKTTSVSMVGGGIPKPQTVAKNYVSATPKSKISISTTLKNKTIMSKSPMR